MPLSKPPQTSRRRLATLFFRHGDADGHVGCAFEHGVQCARSRASRALGARHHQHRGLHLAALHGALADQRMAPVRLLRWLAMLTSITLALTCTALHLHLSRCGGAHRGSAAGSRGHCRCGASPAASCFRSFRMRSGSSGRCVPLPPAAGWPAAGSSASCCNPMRSLVGGFTAAGLWLVVGGITFMIPAIPPTDTSSPRSWVQILGLDALSLLRHRDHRIVFITAALYCMPLAAFYPYTALQMKISASPASPP
jgi:hypothetical protein